MEELKKNTTPMPDDDSYYDQNRKKIRLQQKIYYQTHKRKLNEAAKQYYVENKDEVLEKNKISVRKKNYDKQYYLKNKAKIRERRKHIWHQKKLKEKIKSEVRGNNN